MIEGTIAGLTGERFSKYLVVDLAEEVMEMHAAFNDPQKYSVHEARFRQIVARGAANSILDALLETLILNSGSSQLQRPQLSQDLRRFAEMHREIYRAIRSRNPIRAKILREQHLRETFRRSKVEED